MPTIPELFDVAVKLHQQGDFARAEAFYRQVLQADPNHADALHLLGVLAHQCGRHEAAIALIRQALAVKPATPLFHFNLGLAFTEQGRPWEAIECYRQAVRFNPGYADALCNLGIVLNDQDLSAEAVKCLEQALPLNPNQPIILRNLGLALKKVGRLAEAADYFRRALQVDPGDAFTHTNLGIVLKDRGLFPEAAGCFRLALSIDPRNADAHCNLGCVLANEGSLDEALACFQTALALNPRLVEAHNNLGIAQAVLGLRREARDQFEQALKVAPGDGAALRNRALLRLLEGDFEGGWPDYEYRWTQLTSAPRVMQQPRWDGSAFRGQTVLVFAEQGLGDTIQFARYLPLVKERGGKVLFECPPALAGLLAAFPSVDQLIEAGSPLPPFDAQIPLLSLPGVFATSLATIPARVPYVTADASRRRRWGEQVGSRQGLKIGIAWQGSRLHPGDRYRSLPLAHFEVLGLLDGVRLFSMQVGGGTEQLQTASFPVTDLGSRFDETSFEDIAAALTTLDLVVTADTAVAHLAGALAMPVWVLLPLTPDWRWLLEREDSPWYPTMRLFRQKRLGDWSEVLARVVCELRRLIDETVAGPRR